MFNYHCIHAVTNNNVFSFYSTCVSSHYNPLPSFSVPKSLIPYMLSRALLILFIALLIHHYQIAKWSTARHLYPLFSEPWGLLVLQRYCNPRSDLMWPIQISNVPQISGCIKTFIHYLFLFCLKISSLNHFRLICTHQLTTQL